MALAQADRIAFSLQVVSAPVQAAQIDQNKAAIQAQVALIAALDAANKNLMSAPNTLIGLYQPEISLIDGNVRTSIVEQDIQDSANKILGNHFFPNNTSVVVPSLSAKNNVWPQIVPYALGYAIGKNYSEGYTQLANYENLSISTILAFTDTSDVTAITAAVTTYKSVLVTLLSAVPTTDANATNKANNQTAIANISIIMTACNAYLAATHPTPVVVVGPPTSSTNPPDTTFDTLKVAVQARQTFLVTRIAQINAILGSISQDVSTGLITSSSGAYAQRYNVLSLRLNSLSGSLSQIANMQSGISAQVSLKAGILSGAATYASFVPSSLLKTDASGLVSISVANPGLFSVGDTVYVYAEGQTELLRAVKTINNDMITLNDVVPSKYTVSINARIYKDLT